MLAEAAVQAGRTAARYLGVDVYINGEKAPQGAFLAEADYVRRWRGLAIGAYYPPAESKRTGQLNFHGLVMPTPAAGWLQTLSGGMGSAIDVEDCEGLKLELPARKAIIDNDFLRELRQEVQRTLMLAAAAASEPIPVQAHIRPGGRAWGSSSQSPPRGSSAGGQRRQAASGRRATPASWPSGAAGNPRSC